MFGQIVIGPPGSGKTTYCHAMQQFLTAMKRKVVLVNLDPANDSVPYKCDIDLNELITLSDVMSRLNLGPNGGLIFCMEYLEKNIDWLKKKLSSFGDQYFLFDCPGQVELYTHNNAVKNIVSQLTKWDYRVAAVHLVDSHYCSDPAKFISILLTSLSTMLQIELPHVNVLSKGDMIEKYGRLPFNLDFYTDVLDMDYLLEHIQDDPFFAKYKKLNHAIVELVQDYSLVNFTVLDVQDKQCMMRVMQEVDKANGYVYGSGEERNLQSLMSCAVGAEFQYEKIANIREKHMDLSGDLEYDLNSEGVDSEMAPQAKSDLKEGVREDVLPGTSAPSADLVTSDFNEGTKHVAAQEFLLKPAGDSAETVDENMES